MSLQTVSSPRPQGASEVDYNPWTIHEKSYQAGINPHHFSLFALGNGYLGLRGSHEDRMLPTTQHESSGKQDDDGQVGTYLNGFYESAVIQYGEIAYGYASESQTMLNVANPLPIQLKVNGRQLDLDQAMADGTISAYSRELQLREGLLVRNMIWEAFPGVRIQLTSQRMVSLTNKAIAAMQYQILALDESVNVEVTSILDGNTHNRQSGNDPRVGSGLRGQAMHTAHTLANPHHSILHLTQATIRSGLELGCSISHEMKTQDHGQLVFIKPTAITAPCEDEPGRVKLVYQTTVAQGQAIDLTKYIAFTDSRDFEPQELLEKADALSSEACALGFAKLVHQQRDYLDRYWKHSQIKLDGDPALQQGLNFNLFHLLQSAGRDGKTNISAKGLSGEGYEGHYFWDTEMYMLPYFLHTSPEISKALLTYRYTILPQARSRAREMGHTRGALYAWRTINGNECSAYYPAGTAQYHINADVAFAVSRYVESTGDNQFLLDMGAEILFETAELWLDLGFYNPEKSGQFCINSVTGPDEYNVLVNNNYYTNIMAQANLRKAAAAARYLKQKHPDRYLELKQALNMDLDDLTGQWQQASDRMYLPSDKAKDILLQDDAFLDRIPWDFQNVPRSQYPLLLHFHPLVIYRHRVIKQPDLVLAQLLHGDSFTFKDKKRAFDYYESCTTHDSSLSTSIHAVMACELGYSNKAFRYFMTTARLDLEDQHHNTQDGLHLANMAGTWMVMVNGYAGVRVIDGYLSFKPQIDQHWDAYSFRFAHAGCLLNVTVNKDMVVYTLLEGTSIAFNHHASPIVLSEQNPRIEMPLVPVVDRSQDSIQAVIFDLDGVLLSTDEQHYQEWKKMADEEGIYFDRTINKRLRGVSRLESLEIILEKAQIAYDEQEKIALAERKNAYYQELIQQIKPQSVLPGVVDFLTALKKKGILLATASSSKNAPTLLKLTGLDRFFDAMADGNDITRSKPDPEVFLLASERLNLAPNVCLVVEDAVAGIEAAKSGGFRSLAVGDAAEQSLICNPEARALDLNHVQVEDLDDIYYC
jgi:alpha,alpha-trehalose phosphorylase